MGEDRDPSPGPRSSPVVWGPEGTPPVRSGGVDLLLTDLVAPVLRLPDPPLVEAFHPGIVTRDLDRDEDVGEGGAHRRDITLRLPSSPGLVDVPGEQLPEGGAEIHGGGPQERLSPLLAVLDLSGGD